jgi:hypothetical protein
MQGPARWAELLPGRAGPGRDFAGPGRPGFLPGRPGRGFTVPGQLRVSDKGFIFKTFS